MKAFEKAYQTIEQLQHDPEQGLMEYNYELPPRTISIQEIFHKTLPESCPALKRENVRQSSPR